MRPRPAVVAVLRWLYDAATRPPPRSSRAPHAVPVRTPVSYVHVSVGFSAPSAYEKRMPETVAVAAAGELRL